MHLLALLDSDQILVSCGVRVDSPVLIHSTKNCQLLVSTYAHEQILDL